MNKWIYDEKTISSHGYLSADGEKEVPKEEAGYHLVYAKVVNEIYDSKEICVEFHNLVSSVSKYYDANENRIKTIQHKTGMTFLYEYNELNECISSEMKMKSDDMSWRVEFDNAEEEQIFNRQIWKKMCKVCWNYGPLTTKESL